MAYLKKRNTKHKNSRTQKNIHSMLQIYGLHAVKASLENNKTPNQTLYITPNAKKKLCDCLENNTFTKIVETTPQKISRLVGAQAVHQGAVLFVEKFVKTELKDVLNGQLLVILDQITDPHNAGAILRTANVFGAEAVIAPQRNVSAKSSVFIKASSGAYEYTPFINVVNLGRTLDTLHDNEFTILGFSEEAEESIAQLCFDHEQKLAIVIGSEGKGIRPSIKQKCDTLIKIDSYGKIQTLNASCATSVALHTIRTKQSTVKKQVHKNLS